MIPKKPKINKKLVKDILNERNGIDTDYAIQHFMAVHLAVGYSKVELQKIVDKVLEAKK